MGHYLSTAMQQIHRTIRGSILYVLDFFYPLFRSVMPLQTYRYAACGGFNTVFGIVLYFIGYNFIFQKQVAHLPFMAISPHIAADFLFGFPISFPVGFYLSRYVVFQESTLKGRIQLFRYFVVVCCCIVINYYGLKFFVEVLHLFPTIAKIITSVFVIVFSYISQRNFSFKTAKVGV
jgi:putative flippase GtrA